MCVIVDANAAAETLASTPSEDAVPVRNWLEKANGRMVFGGVLQDELAKVKTAWRSIYKLWQAGRAIQIPRSRIEQETSIIKAKHALRSDDPHVIALARVSGARVLFSRDRALHADFGNPELVANPRGRVYQRRSHMRLLHHDASCRRITGFVD